VNKLKTFWQALAGTFTSITYYKKVIKAPLSFSFKFYFFFFFIFSIIVTAVIGAKILRPVSDAFHKVPSQIVNTYPSELVITIKNGQAQTNVPEPYFIKPDQLQPLFDENKKDDMPDDVKKENLLVIDTQATLEDVDNYDTLVLLTKNYLITKRSNGRLDVTSLEKVPNIVINREFIRNIGDKFSGILQYLLPMMILLVFIAIFIFFSLWNLIYLAFLSIILWIISKLLSFTITFGKLYQIGLHLIVVTTTLFAVLDRFINLQIPFFQSIIYIAFGSVILHKIKPDVNKKK